MLTNMIFLWIKLSSSKKYLQGILSYIFRPAFYLYAVLKVASGALMLSIDLEFKQPAQNLLEDVISVFRNVEIVALFIACFIMGKE